MRRMRQYKCNCKSNIHRVIASVEDIRVEDLGKEKNIWEKPSHDIGCDYCRICKGKIDEYESFC